jgi:hypothetical protein
MPFCPSVSFLYRLATVLLVQMEDTDKLSYSAVNKKRPRPMPWSFISFKIDASTRKSALRGAWWRLMYFLN